MTQMPPPSQPTQPMQPHRGVLILVFSILSWVVCVIFGIVAWVLANSDLRAMEEGRMDPTGEGLTKAGKIVSMISVIVSIIGLVVGVIVLIGMGIIAAGAAASGGATP
jgi:hypothetical protein